MGGNGPRPQPGDAVGASPPSGSSVGAAVTAAGAVTRSLLSGPGARGRWRRFAVLTAMAGIVGAGAAPPPLGLLQIVWDTPATRTALCSDRTVQALIGGLVLLLIGMGTFGRAFTFAFLEGISTGRPDVRAYRRHLRTGAAHFAWTSALTVPLYLVLFAGEWLVSQEALGRFTTLVNHPTADATSADLIYLLLGAGLKFLVVLVPWTILTLPPMVLMYELTPAAASASGSGSLAALSSLWRLARQRPGTAAGYFLVRLGLQVAGNTAALVALLPGTLVAGIVCSPLLAGGLLLSRDLGGTATATGVLVGTITVLLSVLVLYFCLCIALVPLSIFLYALAHEITTEKTGLEPRSGALRQVPPEQRSQVGAR